MKPRVLIVDDNPENIMILAKALETLVDASFATSGEDAVDMVNQAEPNFDLVLLDVAMGGMDGHEVCRRLKSNPETEPIPVIFVTASREVASECLGLALGASDYIIKPISIEIVRARVKTQLELKRKTDLLERMAMIDSLSRISNRRRFDLVLAQEWSHAAQHGGCLALIMMDIDHFKAFNDTYGHIEGDSCIEAVALALTGVMKDRKGTVARYGGEEFGVLVPGMTIEQAAELAEQLRQAVETAAIPHSGSSCADHVTLSMGVASMIPDSADPTELTARADERLYDAKHGGRNRVRS